MTQADDRDQGHLQCLSCGCDMHGAPEARCPECGSTAGFGRFVSDGEARRSNGRMAVIVGIVMAVVLSLPIGTRTPLPIWSFMVALLLGGGAFKIGSAIVAGAGFFALAQWPRGHRRYALRMGTYVVVLVLGVLNAVWLGYGWRSMVEWQSTTYAWVAVILGAVGPALAIFWWIRGRPASFEAAVIRRAVPYLWVVTSVGLWAGELP